jgi:hypothetical protein
MLQWARRQQRLVLRTPARARSTAGPPCTLWQPRRCQAASARCRQARQPRPAHPPCPAARTAQIRCRHPGRKTQRHCSAGGCARQRRGRRLLRRLPPLLARRARQVAAERAPLRCQRCQCRCRMRLQRAVPGRRPVSQAGPPRGQPQWRCRAASRGEVWVAAGTHLRCCHCCCCQHLQRHCRRCTGRQSTRPAPAEQRQRSSSPRGTGYCLRSPCWSCRPRQGRQSRTLQQGQCRRCSPAELQRASSRRLLGRRRLRRLRQQRRTRQRGSE